MAEFCLECLNKMYGRNDSTKKYIISKEYDLCEGCGEWKNVVVAERKSYYLYQMRCFLLPFIIIYRIIYFLFRLMTLPYLIYRYKMKKGK